MSTRPARRYRLLSFLSFLFILTCFACAHPDPIAPTPAQPHEATGSASGFEQHHFLGEWTVSIYPDAGNPRVEASPVRSSTAHWNVTDLLIPPVCPGCVTFKNPVKIDDSHVTVTVEIAHPFPGSATFDAFDVKGIVMAPPQLWFPSGSVSRVIDNPDGYTSRWSHEPLADINPFVDLATDNSERRFAHDSVHERDVIVHMPKSGPGMFEYVVDACWLPPAIVDPGNPSLSPHCNEAWGIKTLISGPIDAHPNAFAKIDIDFNDWQSDGEAALVSLEAPDLAPNAVQAVFEGESASPHFACEIPNDLSAAPGVHPALICIRDALNNPSNDALTTFSLVEINVTADTPPIDALEISPSAASLSTQGSSVQLKAAVRYSDGCLGSITDGVKWEIWGTDLNGNPLAKIEAGKATRLTSRWWGGTASVTANYEKQGADAVVYCEDPFADVADVTFGFPNVPGEGYTDPASLLGPPSGGGSTGGGTEVCALGYGGVATLEFVDNVIVDGPGPDFIVFENPFEFASCDWKGETERGVWNETAVVEVSRDGIDWLRFPCDYSPDNVTCGIEPHANMSSFSGIAGVNPVHAAVYPDGSLKDGIDPTDPWAAGGDAFDLADVGLTWCRFVRLIDTGDSVDAPGSEQYDDDGDLIMDFGKVSPMGAIPGYAGFDGDSVAAVHSASPLTVK